MLHSYVPKLSHVAFSLVVLCAIATILTSAFPAWSQPVIKLCDRLGRSEDPKWHGWPSIDKLFVFGDSHSAGGFDPHGPQPSAENPFGNPVFPNGRVNGGIFPDFLTLTHNQSLIRTYNLAQGGATVDNSAFASVYGSVSFRGQFETMFAPNYGSPDTPPDLRWDPSKTLFMMHFGINDVTIDYLRDDLHLVLSGPIAAYDTLLTRLYTYGARNFLILNVGPVDKNFALKTGETEKTKRLKGNIAQWNEQLQQLRTNLTNTHHDVTAFIFDMNQFLPWLAKNPTNFEATKDLKNTTDVCVEYAFGLGVPPKDSGLPSFEQKHPVCGVPLTQYFWANEFHMTYPVQNATAAAIVEDCFGDSRTRFCS